MGGQPASAPGVERTTGNASVTGGDTAERRSAVVPVRAQAQVGRLRFCYFISSRLSAMTTMPAVMAQDAVVSSAERTAGG